MFVYIIKAVTYPLESIKKNFLWLSLQFIPKVDTELYYPLSSNSYLLTIFVSIICMYTVIISLFFLIGSKYSALLWHPHVF